MSYWDSCRCCGRKRVALVFRVHALTDRRTGAQRRHVMGGVCLLTGECEAVFQRRKAKQEQRGKLPKDAALRKLHEAEGGRCKWCGEAIYRVDRRGRVVVDRRRMWHEGRLVHPDAEPEPRCVQEYNAQGFTFRDQVGLRDHGVCASCGRDCEAELAAWRARDPYRAWDAEDAGDWYERPFAERDAGRKAWLAEEPVGWHADHIVPLEDGGEHLLANAQTLCTPCHVAKTARENSERAARRRGDEPDRQTVLGDSL